ncbi:MAG: GPP34 family phosphoprotein [Candidatus Thermoplasmatota archaeon]
MDVLADDLVLLAFSPENGRMRFAFRSSVAYAVAGALLEDLALHGHITVVDKRVRVLDESSVGDARLDEALHRLVGSRRTRSADSWVWSLGWRMGDAPRATYDVLAQRGILLVRKGAWFGLIPVQRHALHDRGAHARVVTRVHEALSLGEAAAPRERALLALAHASRAIRPILTREARRTAKPALKRLLQDDPYARAVRHAIDAQGSAVVGAGGAG